MCLLFVHHFHLREQSPNEYTHRHTHTDTHTQTHTHSQTISISRALAAAIPIFRKYRANNIEIMFSTVGRRKCNQFLDYLTTILLMVLHNIE
jgi:hypothetical protein